MQWREDNIKLYLTSTLWLNFEHCRTLWIWITFIMFCVFFVFYNAINSFVIFYHVHSLSKYISIYSKIRSVVNILWITAYIYYRNKFYHKWPFSDQNSNKYNSRSSYSHIGCGSQCRSDSCLWWRAGTGSWRCWWGTAGPVYPDNCQSEGKKDSVRPVPQKHRS